MCSARAYTSGSSAGARGLEHRRRHVAQGRDAGLRRPRSPRRRPRTGSGARCTRTPRAGAASPSGRRRARRRRAASAPRDARACGSRGAARCPSSPNADANWSMSPQLTPTYRFSARCAVCASVIRSSGGSAAADERERRRELEGRRARQAGALGQVRREHAAEPARSPRRHRPAPRRSPRCSRSRSRSWAPMASRSNAARSPVAASVTSTRRSSVGRIAIAIPRSMATGSTNPSL